MRIVCRPIERELQYPCPRNPELIAQRRHVSRDEPQILGDEGQTTERIPDRTEECGARPGLPLTSARVRRAGGNMPRRGEPAEVVQADGVDVCQQRPDPVDPPSEPGPPMRLPVIHGIAPELSVGAERVGRDGGHEARPPLIVEQEELRVRPHIAGIGGHEERQIAEQAHPFRMRVCPQALGLSDQQKLREADSIDVSRQLAPCRGERGGDSLHERRRPGQVMRAVVLRLQGLKQCVVRQPVCLRFAKLVEGDPQLAARGAPEVEPDCWISCLRQAMMRS